jgi:hypothetical protein
VSIPLTIDWNALSWLGTRLGCFWRARPAARLMLLGWVLASLTACVPTTQFEETQSAAQVEREGRRRAEQQVQEASRENAELRQQMQQEKRELDQRDQALSQAELDTSAQGKQRQEAETMVEQLRGELARAGTHLQTFHDDKQKLEQALSSETVHARAIARFSRDLTLAFAEPLESGEYTLDAEQDVLVLRVSRREVLSETWEPKPKAARLLDGVAALLEQHRQAKLCVYDASAPSDPLRVEKLIAALEQRGVARGRYEPLAQQAAASETADGPELVLSFSEP